MSAKRSNKVMALLRDIVRRNSVTSFRIKKAVKSFCEKTGLVYFGYVDQHHDDHAIIRGLTASSAHIDEHYSVGSIDGYDLSLVYRTDSIDNAKGELVTHSWLIVEIDLRSKDLPHVFIGDHDHTNSAYMKLFTTHTTLQKVPFDASHAGGDEFARRYSIYSQAAHFIDVKQIFNPDVTRILAAHFWPLSIELHEDTLYIYSDKSNISVGLLEAMTKNGLWLADRIDNSIPSS